MPDNRGVFDLPACIRWRLEREADAMAPKTATPEGEKWLTLFRKERARIARIDRLERQGKVLPREELLPEWAQVYQEFRQACLGLENKLPPLLEGLNQDEMRQVLREHNRAALSALARPGTNRPDPRKTEKPEKAKTAKPRKARKR